MTIRRTVLTAAYLAVAMLAATPCARAEEDVLYWMVGDGAQVDNGDAVYSITDFFSTFGPADSSYAARVRVTGGDISSDTFLDIYGPDETGSFKMLSGDLGVDFLDTGSGYWGAGVPTGNQSPSGDYSAGTPEYAFIVELGNVAWDQNGNGSWTTLATSAPANYSTLGEYIAKSFDMTLPTTKIWQPMHFTAVPEPSCGLMVLLGTAALALRRRRLA